MVVGEGYISPLPHILLYRTGSDPSRKDETTNARTYILGAVLLIALLVLPAAACPPQLPTCPPGEVWGQTDENCYQVPAVYGPCNECPHHHQEVCHQEYGYWTGPSWNRQWHDRTGQNCPGGQTCVFRQVCEDQKVYDCHGEGYVPCGFEWQHKEKQIITPAHEQCDPVYGCIAVSCPAVPCPDGQDCVDGQCLQRECPRIPCDEGFHCVENQCVPDICGEDFQCAEGFQCGDQNQCGEIPRTSSFSPYTEPTCQAILTNKRPMDDIDPSTLPLLDLKNTYISAAFHYVSQFDCVYMAYYTRGEPSFNQHCTAVEYYNREQEVVYSHGGMPVLTAMNPAGAVCVAAVKNSAAESTLPVTITLTDSHGTTVDSIVSSDPVIVQCYRLPDDFNECRLRDSFLQAMSWVK